MKISKYIHYYGGLFFDRFIKEYRTEGLVFDVPRKPPPINRGRYTFDLHERAERYLVKKYLKPDAIVLELGGGIGVVSCLINKRLNRPDQHVVFEPSVDLIPILKTNRDKNSSKFSIEQSVLGVEADFSGQQFVKRGLGFKVGIPEQNKGRPKREVTLVSPDEFVTRYPYDFNTLVMDIEGAEYQLILNHFKHFPNIHLILMERHPSVLSEEKNQQIDLALKTMNFQLLESRSDVEAWFRHS